MCHKINLLVPQSSEVLHTALQKIPKRKRAEFIRMHATFSLLSAANTLVEATPALSTATGEDNVATSSLSDYG